MPCPPDPSSRADPRRPPTCQRLIEPTHLCRLPIPRADLVPASSRPTDCPSRTRPVSTTLPYAAPQSCLALPFPTSRTGPDHARRKRLPMPTAAPPAPSPSQSDLSRPAHVLASPRSRQDRRVTPTLFAAALSPATH